MPKPTHQDIAIMWLKSVGYKEVKRLTGCVVLTLDGFAFWYVGKGGSVRYGRTRAEAYPRPKYFQLITGQSLDLVTRGKILPGPSVAGLEI